VLPAQVLREAVRHLDSTQVEVLQQLLGRSGYEQIPEPSAQEIAEASGIVRSRTDVPIAVSLLNANVDVLVSSDRDFTDPGATRPPFSTRVRVMLPAVFLREVVGWSSEQLEAIRHRNWEDLR
jgi:hypothetical protein